MLYITFKKSDGVLIYIDSYFNLNYEDIWFEDQLIKEMILDVDKSTVVSANCIESPVLGFIAPQKLSGGVKALILMLKESRVVWATACGDNCAKWIVEIAKQKDITICLEHVMEFPDEFEAICLDNNTEIHNMLDFRRCVHECL